MIFIIQRCQPPPKHSAAQALGRFVYRRLAVPELRDSPPARRQRDGGVNWAFMPDTVLSFERLRGDYANDDTSDLLTTQLTAAY